MHIIIIKFFHQISFGMLFHDENTTDGITKVIEHFHQYLDKVDKGEDAKCVEEGLVGDQLTNILQENIVKNIILYKKQ